MKAFFIVLLIYSLNAYSQSNKEYSSGYSLTNINALTPAGEYQSPKWSPDGNKILFTKLSTTGLFVLDLKTKRIVKLNMLRGAGYDASWSQDSRSIYYRHTTPDKYKKFKSHTETKSINILTGEITDHPDISIYSIPGRASAKSNNDVIIYLDPKTYIIKARTMDKSKEWDVTKEGKRGGVYYGIAVSPDRTKVLVHQNGKMLIYATDGSGLISSLGRGIGGSWSSDGKKILFHISQDDGHRITGSDLYVINSDGSERWRLTNTPDVFEERPDWSPDNKQIVFSDINKGIIYIADLIKN